MNDVRIIGVITVTCLLLISLAGMEWESKVIYFIYFFTLKLFISVNFLLYHVILSENSPDSDCVLSGADCDLR